MKTLRQYLAAYRRRTTAWLAGLAVLALAIGTSLSFAQGTTTRSFDHLSTGFALTGMHVQTRCESCHLNGIFKGTPRDCASCHVAGNRFARGNVVRPQQHVPTQAACDTCHNTKTYVGARFNHAGVMPGTCQSCHNGQTAGGKTSGHIATTASCDTCHRTTAWSPAAAFDHTGVVPGTCTSCHGAGKASAKSPTHMPTNANQSCDDCHKTFTGWRPTAWNHTQMVVASQCASCHNGAYPPADGRPANHVPYTLVAAAANANCDACHKGSVTTWTNGRFHSNFSVSTGCAGCHNGGFMGATAKPNTAVHSGVTNCESCHTPSGWAGAKVDHSTFNTATNCTTCHNGSTATAKPATHMPTGTTGCFACHNVSPAGWKPTKWTHTQMVVAAQCDSCHTGGYPPADGKPANHVPYAAVPAAAAAKCDTCHKGSFTTWANGRFHGSVSVSTGCVTCHTLSAAGSYLGAVGKPTTTTHATVTGNCESCHKSTTTWAGARVDHSTFNAATNCTTCHNGSSATGKPATHIPTTANCFSCHNVSPAGWTPTKWNHTQVTVTNACATCHTGGYPPADGRPANHVPYQTVAVTAAANCDGCHRGSTTTWANGKVHAYYSIGTGCVSCHTLTPGGSYLNATGKPATATHSGITGNCESCHKSTASWTSGVVFAHSAANAVGTGTCDTCHNGSTALGKPATHIPITSATAKCDSCHKSQASFAASTTMNHTVVVTQACKGCHNGAYVSQGTQGALPKPTNHIPEVQLLNGAAMDCNACHTGTTAWSSMTMNHNNSQGNGAGWCKACHATGTSYLGSMERKSLTHRSATATDCSQSGCHRPLGTKGTTYRNWD